MTPTYFKFTANELGNNIRLWRLVRNYKQEDFAAKLAITRPSLSNIETGKTDVSFSRLMAIASLLNIDVKLLFTPPNPLTIASRRAFSERLKSTDFDPFC